MRPNVVGRRSAGSRAPLVCPECRRVMTTVIAPEARGYVPGAAPGTVITLTLPVMPAGRPVWLSAVASSNDVHLAETEDGDVRTLDLRGWPAAVATCGALLTGPD